MFIAIAVFTSYDGLTFIVGEIQHRRGRPRYTVGAAGTLGAKQQSLI